MQSYGVESWWFHQGLTTLIWTVRFPNASICPLLYALFKAHSLKKQAWGTVCVTEVTLQICGTTRTWMPAWFYTGTDRRIVPMTMAYISNPSNVVSKMHGSRLNTIRTKQETFDYCKIEKIGGLRRSSDRLAHPTLLSAFSLLSQQRSDAMLQRKKTKITKT